MSSTNGNYGCLPALFAGIFVLFWAVIMMLNGEFVNFCLPVLLIIGIVLFYVGFLDSSNFLTTFAAGLIWTGVVCFSFAVLVAKQDAVHDFYEQGQPTVPTPKKTGSKKTLQTKPETPKRLDFNDILPMNWAIYFGIAFVGTGVFLLFPPNLSGKWKRSKVRGNIGKGNMENNSMARLHYDDLNEDVVDQAIADILNANTNLQSLSRTNPDLAGKIQHTFDYYNPNAGVFGSWAKRLRGEGRTKLLEVLNKEQQLLIEQAALFEKQVREGKKQQVEFAVFLAENVMSLLEIKAKAELNKQAFGKGMFVEAYSDVNKEEELRKIREREYQARTNIDELREEGRSQRQQREEEERHRREQEAEEARIKRNIEAAIQYKLNEDKITQGYRQQLETALNQLDALEHNTEISEFNRQTRIARKKSEIETLNSVITAREKKAVEDEQKYL